MSVYRAEIKAKQHIPIASSVIQAGFPSPADDYIDKSLDLNEHLITHPSSTFYLRVEGESMKNAGIFPGDLLIVDKSLSPTNNAVVVAIVNGEFTVKRFIKKHGYIVLQPENSSFQPIQITAHDEFSVWGVVTYVIHQP